MDPAFAIAICRYDLSGGPIKLTVPVSQAYTSVSFYTRNEVAYYAINDRSAGRKVIELDLMTEAQHADLPEDEDVTAADRLIIDSPTATGLIVMKALAPEPGLMPQAQASLAASSCKVQTEPTGQAGRSAASQALIAARSIGLSYAQPRDADGAVRSPAAPRPADWRSARRVRRSAGRRRPPCCPAPGSPAAPAPSGRTRSAAPGIAAPTARSGCSLPCGRPRRRARAATIRETCARLALRLRSRSSTRTAVAKNGSKRVMSSRTSSISCE